MERKLILSLDSLEAIMFAIASEKDIDAASFHHFAQLDHDSDDVNSALLWAPSVRGPDRRAFVAAQVTAGIGDYGIKEWGPSQSPVVAAERNEYLPSVFEQSHDDNHRVVGLDMLTVPELAERADSARDEGNPIATPSKQYQLYVAIGFDVADHVCFASVSWD